MTQGLKTGSTLRHGTYRIERILGQGGFGITYLAIDLNLDRKVAIKEFFPKDYCDREGETSQVTLGTRSTEDFVTKLKAKFLKEARNIAKFDNPGIIRIHAAFEENHTAYYVMDYIEGINLSEMVKRGGPLPVNKALEYIHKIGEALEYLHIHRMNHLDVKPANIMVRSSDDMPVLIDFGLSKQYDSEGQQTTTTPTGISHGYAPLEQYNANGVKEFSPQTDLYSLAATLYYILSGVVPPQAIKLVDETLMFPKEIPIPLMKPIGRAMSSARRKRYESIRTFLKELDTAKESDATIIPSSGGNKIKKTSTSPKPVEKTQPQRTLTPYEMVDKGVEAYNKGNYSEALRWWHKAAEQGNAEGQYSLGVMYENGRGVWQDYSEAVRWYRKAAEQGNAEGQYSLGVMYRNGWGVWQDYSEAVRWWRKAAEQGYASAQYSLGNMYYKGLGVSQDYSEAVRWYRKLAEREDAEAQCNLGNMYYKGLGVSQDYSEAVRWYRKAAEQGNADAQNNLGNMYYNGFGVTQDRFEAKNLWEKSAARGNQTAVDNLKNWVRNHVIILK